MERAQGDLALPVSGRQAMEVDEMLQRVARQTFGESRGILIETSGSLAEPGIRCLENVSFYTILCVVFWTVYLWKKYNIL